MIKNSLIGLSVYLLLSANFTMAQSQQIDPIVKASPYGDKYVWSYAAHDPLPWSIFKPNDFGTAKVIFDNTGVRDLGKVPAPGIHPRMFFSPNDLPAIRKRLKETRAGQEAWKNVLEYSNALRLSYDEKADYAKPDWMNGSFSVHGRCPLFRIGGYGKREDYYSELAEGKTPTKEFAWMQAMSTEALRCLIDDDKAASEKLIKATVTAVKIEQDLRAKNDKPILPGQPPKPSTNRMKAIALGFIYDFTFNYMNPEQKKIIHDELVNISAWQDNYGTFNGAENSRSNWAGFSYWVFDLMALEGDEGFNDLKFRGLYKGLRNFYSTSFFDAGTAYEAEGKLLFALDAVSVYDRLSEKYGLEKLSCHPLLRKHLSNFSISSVLPTLKNFAVFDILGAMGRGLCVPLDVVVAHYLYPNDKKIDFLYKVTVGEDYSKLPNRVDNNVNSVIISALFATDYDQSNDPRQLGLPESYFCGQRALMMTRSSWDTNATFLTMHTRGVSGGHPYRDRNGIMLAGKGRSWITIPGHDGETEGWRCNTVLIDGRNQDNSTPARMVDYVNNDHATFAVGDAKYCWDWSWRRVDNNKQGKQATYEDFKNNNMEIGLGYVPVEHCFNDFAYTKIDDPKFKNPVKCFPHWVAVDGSVSGYAKQVSTPVLKSFRTSGLVRGKYPYALVIDDIQRNAFKARYDFNLTLMEDLVLLKDLPLQTQKGDIILTSQTSINSNGKLKKGEPALLIRVLEGKGDMQLPLLRIKEKVNLFTLTTDAVSPDFKIMLYPFKEGEPLPKSQWNKKMSELTVDFGDQKDNLSFSASPSGKTNLRISRDGKEIISVNKEVPLFKDADTDSLDAQLMQLPRLIESSKSFNAEKLPTLAASWSFENQTDSLFKSNQGDVAQNLMANGTILETGIVGKGVRFNQKKGIEMPFKSTEKTIDNVSFSCWVKADQDFKGGTIFDFHSKGGFALDIVQGQGRFSTQGVFGIGRVNTNVLTDWTNFTVTCSPKEVILYRDGLKLITVPVTMKIDKSNAIRLGQGFSGLFDEVKLFNSTLDEETVKKLYLSTYYQLATTK